MVKKIPLVLTSGKVSQLNILTEELVGAPDFHSGYNSIGLALSIVVEETKQMINFTQLSLDGELLIWWIPIEFLIKTK